MNHLQQGYAPQAAPLQPLLVHLTEKEILQTSCRA
jgi:hypothetical protein